MNYIKDTGIITDSGTFNMIVEIKKGSKDKNELVDGSFDKLERVRKIKYKYPFYYGCFPRTHAGDNDPLDCILVSNKKHRLLEIVNVEVIGVIKTIDNGEIDDKIITIPFGTTLTEEETKKIYKDVLNFLTKYKGKHSNTVVDTNVYSRDVAMHLMANACAKYVDLCTIKQITQSSLKIKI